MKNAVRATDGLTGRLGNRTLSMVTGVKCARRSIALARDIEVAHDRALAAWYHGAGCDAPGDGELAEVLVAHHRCNFELWGLEDDARRSDAGDAFVVAAKRSIDTVNQRRNDLVETMDDLILREFAEVDRSRARLHSETAGLMIDRLSILSLKIRNFGVAAAHAGDCALSRDCTRTVAVLETQRSDLADCLRELLDDFAAGRRHFKSYRQFKAYNDPRLSNAMAPGEKGG